MRRWLIVVIWSVLITACAGLSVERDYDTSVNFQALDTYAWQPRKETEGSLLSNRVRNAVDKVLAEKGYRKVAKDKADFLVSYHYAITGEEDDDARVRTSVGLGTGSGGTFGGIGLSIGLGGRDREEAVLGIDVINPGNDRLLWRGVARRPPITESEPAEATAEVYETVEAIFEEFPPE